MNNRFSPTAKTIMLGLIAILLLAACAPTESDIAVSDAWARAASVEIAAEEGEAMSEDEAGESMDVADDEASGMDTMQMGAVSAAFMTIENRGGQADRLLRVTTDVADVVEIHETQVNDESVARMHPLPDGLEIRANSRVNLEPGGYHLMLMDLQEDLVAGETATLTLTFESGKEVTVEAEIRAP